MYLLEDGNGTGSGSIDPLEECRSAGLCVEVPTEDGLCCGVIGPEAGAAERLIYLDTRYVRLVLGLF
jgi:hypothetical protein